MILNFMIRKNSIYIESKLYKKKVIHKITKIKYNLTKE